MAGNPGELVMALHDLTDPTVPPPNQLVFDSSFLLSLRPAADNPAAMARYRLLPQDALILAEAERLGVTAVVTLDHDWRRVTEFDIYTTPV